MLPALPGPGLPPLDLRDDDAALHGHGGELEGGVGRADHLGLLGVAEGHGGAAAHQEQSRKSLIKREGEIIYIRLFPSFFCLDSGN